MEAENKIKELETALEACKCEMGKLVDSREWALAMADSLRDRVCQHDPQVSSYIISEYSPNSLLYENSIFDHQKWMSSFLLSCVS